MPFLFKLIPVIAFTGIFNVADASENPLASSINFGNEMACVGDIENQGATLEVVLFNEATNANEAVEFDPNLMIVWLKSSLKAERIFGIYPTSNTIDTQSFEVHKIVDGERELVTSGTYGAKVVLSSGRPRVEIVHHDFRFEIEMSRGPEPDSINYQSYFAQKGVNGFPTMIAPKGSCTVQKTIER